MITFYLWCENDAFVLCRRYESQNKRKINIENVIDGFILDIVYIESSQSQIVRVLLQFDGEVSKGNYFLKKINKSCILSRKKVHFTYFSVESSALLSSVSAFLSVR